MGPITIVKLGLQGDMLHDMCHATTLPVKKLCCVKMTRHVAGNRFVSCIMLWAVYMVTWHDSYHATILSQKVVLCSGDKTCCSIVFR